MAILSDCLVQNSPMKAKLSFQFRPIQKIASGGTDVGQVKKPKVSEDDYDFIVFGGDDETRLIGTELRKWLSLVLLPALRDAESVIQNWKRSPLRPLLERISKQIPDEKFEEVRSGLDQAKDQLIQAEPLAKLVQAVNKRVRALSGPVHSVTTDLDFAASEPEQLLRSLRIFLKSNGTQPLSDASLGTANIMFLALLLQDLEMKKQAREM